MDCLKMNFFSDNRLSRVSLTLGSGASTGLGSGTWITYTDGSAIQHLHYLPFGEEQIDQRLTNFNSRYTFSAKEKDIETGYSYFGARYYTSDLSIWLSVDPMADKYPSLSPYCYTANNPIKLIDPNGMEVEYNSFADKIRVGFLRIIDSKFRSQFKTLKNSKETYSFRGYKDSDEGYEGDFSTDGNKLYINYNISSSEKDGSNFCTNLRHETQHGVQFEEGRIGFELNDVGGPVDRDGTYFPNKQWTLTNYDVTDEKEAFNAGFSFGTVLNSGKINGRNLWKNASDEKRIFAINKEYPELSTHQDESHNGNERIKTSNEYKMPYKRR